MLLKRSMFLIKAHFRSQMRIEAIITIQAPASSASESGLIHHQQPPIRANLNYGGHRKGRDCLNTNIDWSVLQRIWKIVYNQLGSSSRFENNQTLKPSSRWLGWWETWQELCFWRIGTIAIASDLLNHKRMEKWREWVCPKMGYDQGQQFWWEKDDIKCFGMDSSCSYKT